VPRTADEVEADCLIQLNDGLFEAKEAGTRRRKNRKSAAFSQDGPIAIDRLLLDPAMVSRSKAIVP